MIDCNNCQPEALQILDRLLFKLTGKTKPELECSCINGKSIYYSSMQKEWQYCEKCNPRKQCPHCLGTGTEFLPGEGNYALPYCRHCTDTKEIARKFNSSGYSTKVLDYEGFIEQKPAPYHPESSQNTEDSVAYNTARKEIHENDKQFLIISGTSGTGKTLQASFLHRDLSNTSTAMLINFESVLDELDERNRDNPPRAIIAKYLSPQYLIIDALDKEQIRSKFKSILIKRYEAGKTTIITTVMNEEKIEKEFGESLFNRVKASGKIVTLKHQSFYSTNKKKTQEELDKNKKIVFTRRGQ